jgi:hypothetical protein
MAPSSHAALDNGRSRRASSPGTRTLVACSWQCQLGRQIMLRQLAVRGRPCKRRRSWRVGGADSLDLVDAFQQSATRACVFEVSDLLSAVSDSTDGVSGATDDSSSNKLLTSLTSHASDICPRPPGGCCDLIPEKDMKTCALSTQWQLVQASLGGGQCGCCWSALSGWPRPLASLLIRGSSRFT